MDVLSADEDVRADFQQRSPRSSDVDTLPVVVWSRLLFDLEPYLVERRAEGVSLLGFFHQQLAEAAEADYLSAEAPARHAALASYFAAKGYGYSRTLSELAYHLGGGQLWLELTSLLTDVEFLGLTAERLGVSGGRTGYGIEQFLSESLDPLPEALVDDNRKLQHMVGNLAALSAALELFYARKCGRADAGAVCSTCGAREIVHGHIDLGAVDYYDNCFSLCRNCLWSWHTEQYTGTGGDPGVWEFDYASNTYRARYG